LANRVTEFRELIARSDIPEFAGIGRPEIYFRLWDAATDYKYEEGEPFLRDLVSEFGSDNSAEEYVRFALKHLVVFDRSISVGNRFLDSFERANEADIDTNDFAAFGILLS